MNRARSSGRFAIAAVLVCFLNLPLVAQSIDDPLGDVPSGDPSYVDLSRIRVRQVIDKLQVDFYPVSPIPHGNQAGITERVIFELYLDVDSNANTGGALGDIGYDYVLRTDLLEWNGKSWIDGNVYWGIDRNGNWIHSDAYCISESWFVSQRFRWEFSLVSLKWARVDWVARIFYRDHWAERLPDLGHASLYIDTTLVDDLDTAGTEFVEFIYPESYQAVIDSFDIIHTVDEGARVESALCGTDFISKPLLVSFSPWLNGVAYSGNPVKIGSWMWGAEPSWFIYFHELGHNFTFAASRFEKLYPGAGYVPAGGDDWHFGTNFDEAWATMVGLYAIHDLVSNPTSHGITLAAKQNLEGQFAATRTGFLNALQTYESLPDFRHLYPDLVDGIFLTLADSLGYEIIPRWYKILQPPDAPWPLLNTINPDVNYEDAKITSMTITACTFSVAGKTELKSMFVQRWDFPIDDLLYAQIQPEIDSIVYRAVSVGDAAAAPPPAFVSLGNYPNPFNARTTLCFSVAKPGTARLRLYNTLGQLVRETGLGTLRPGSHQIAFDAGDLPSGVYYYIVTTTGGNLKNKMTLVR